MTVRDRLDKIGVSLPAVAKPVGAYVPAQRIGGQVWTSGQLPVVDGELMYRGVLGRDVSLEDGVAAARQCALNALAAVSTIADLDKVGRAVKVTVFIASDPAFTDQAKVANGASELFGEIFDEPHVRSAVGVAVLPLGAPVELELVVDVD